MSKHYRVDSSEEEALFKSSSPYPIYFVQSPSAISHAYEYAYHSPLPSFNPNINPNTTLQEPAHLALSRYSSSRESNNAFLHIHRKIKSCDETVEFSVDHQHCEEIYRREVEHHDDDDEEEVEDERKYNNGWLKYFSFSYSNSSGWICLQIFWRLLLSIMIALFVFYVSAKPPKPKVSIKVTGIRPFGLGEGVDGSGVTTKILTCNCSMDLIVDNKSKLFGLYIQPPALKMFFGKLRFAMSQGKELYAGSDGSTLFKLSVGTRNKAMYSAGRNMEDLLRSGKGLPLIIKLSFTTSFDVVWGLIKQHHHEAQCLLHLGNTYDKRHKTQTFKSTCNITSFSH